MRREAGFFESFDRTKLFYRNWISEEQNPKTCLILHGYGEHSERYEELVHFLADLPYSFFSFDLRGQGRSGGRRVHVNEFDDFVRDAEAYLNFLHSAKIAASDSLTVLGHSLGGLIAIKLTLKLGARVSRLVLSSPFLGAHGLAASDFTFWLSGVLNSVIPGIILPGPAKPGYLFHDPEKMKQYLADMMIERRITAHLANELLCESRRTSARPAVFSCPLLVLASGDDRIVSLKKTRGWFEKAQAAGKELKVYDGFYHEIFHEIGREKPMSDLKRFLDNTEGGK